MDSSRSRHRLLLGMVFIATILLPVQGELTACEIEKMLQPLLEDRSIQAHSLRQRLANILRQNLEEITDNSLDSKRSLSSLAEWNNLPPKRSLEALARGGYLKPTPEDNPQEDPDSLKRSIQNLDRNEDSDGEKRSISSLARNGELTNGKDLTDILDEYYYEKKNIGSLARDYNFPNYGKRFYYPKRNVASLARDGLLAGGKRNVAALLRKDNYMKSHENSQQDQYDEELDKRHLGSVKSQYKSKYKRSTPFMEDKDDVDYYDEEFQPVYQNQNYNYDDLIKLLSAYPNAEKRFLGSVAKSGWPTSLSRFRTMDKRHIGSLARLGWLPSFRSVRRFNRSGRSTNDCCREASANGKTEDNSFPKGSLSLDDKRFLLIPTDNILLSHKFPLRSRTR